MAAPYLKHISRVDLSTPNLELRFLLTIVVCIFAILVVGMRSINIGTDTANYAYFFSSLENGSPDAYVEPGFLFLTKFLAALGFSLVAYQSLLFILLLSTIWLATRNYFVYLRMHRGYLGYFIASLALMFLWPTFVQASINVVREGLAALLVFSALLAFKDRRWWEFVIFGAVAASLHRSSLVFIAFAPALLLDQRTLRIIVGAAFVFYCTGLSRALVDLITPNIYNVVVNYDFGYKYRAGVRLDFAAFSLFWYVLPYLLIKIVRTPMRLRILESTSIYATLLLPFLLIGWGNFSDRWLLPAWMSVPVIVAAMACNSRITALRSSWLASAVLVFSCPVFLYYVLNSIAF